MRVLAVLLLSACFCRSNPLDDQSVAVPAAESKLKRLFGQTKPSSYEIELTLDDDFVTEKAFSGKVTIRFNVEGGAITLFQLHMAKEIDIIDWQINAKTPIAIDRKYYDEAWELMNFRLSEEINHENTVVINYKGVLYDDTVMSGFYLSSYKVGSATKYIAATQFKSTNARKAFPCFDEPSFKAKFTITINHPDGYQAISNQPRAEDQSNDRKTVFETTPVMSTYLVAFIVSEIESVAVKNDNGMSIYYADNTPVEWLSYALETSPEILKHLSAYTNIEYFLTDIKQLLQVAIPDFGPGATENWGLVTYRDELLFFNEDDSTARDERQVTSTIAHEFAHLWFGDLVTTKWWDTVWLNEGFATFFEMEATKAVREDFEMENQFVVEELQSVLVLDSFQSLHALNDEANTETQLRSKFSDITYSKAGSIIRMMNHIMGEERFKLGLQDYLDKNKEGAVTPEELFIALEQQLTGITDIMEIWINKPGYPIVTVNRTDDKNIKLSQERFLYEGVDISQTWNIPISCIVKTERPDFETTTPTLQFDEKTLNVELETKSDDWIILNVQQTGYYRVNYDYKLWKNLKNALKERDFGGIHYMNRAQIIDDVFNLARAGKVDYELALDMSKYLENEKNYFPWYSAFSSFSFLRKRFALGKLNEKVTKHVSKLLKTVYKEDNFYSVPSEHIEKMRTSLVLRWACIVSHKDCRKVAQKRFDCYIERNTKIDPNVRQTVYCEGVKKSVENWDALNEKLKDTTAPSEITDMLYALGCIAETDVLLKYLEMSIDSASIIRHQDANTVFQAVLSGTPQGVDVCLDFVVDKHRDIEEVYGGLTKVVMALSDYVTTQEQVDKFTAFLDTNPKTVTDDNIKIAKDNAKKNLEWITRHQPVLESYFGAAGMFAPQKLLILFVIIGTVFKNV